MIYKHYSEVQLLAILFASVTKGRTHPAYTRTVDHAKWCKQMMTGDDQNSILLRYKRRETEAQKEQRVSVTNSKTQYVTNKIFNLFNEVHRSDRTASEITRDGDDLEPLFDNLDNFQEEISLETYMDHLFRYANFYDANTWVVAEFNNDDPNNVKPVVYPFEVASSAAVDFQYQRGTLQYLTTLEKIEAPKKEQKEMGEVEKFTMYAGAFSYVIYSVPDDVIFEIPEGYELSKMEVKGSDKPHTIGIKRFDTNLDRVPAIRVGYLPDPVTDFTTFVSPIYPAEKIFTDLIWKKSEYDLAHAMHGFYQKFIYVDECPSCQGSMEMHSEKQQTMITCPMCEGTGRNSHTTTQDIIEVIRVATKEEHIPLDEMVHYELIPMDLIKQQKEDLEDLKLDVFNTIFGSNILERHEVEITATEKTYDWRTVNNTLLPYADKYATMYKFLVQMTAEIRQESENLVIDYSFPSSFNLEGLDELIARRKAAVDAGAPYNVIARIDQLIIQKQYQDNTEVIQIHTVRESHRPLRDKQLGEKTFVLNQLTATDPQKVLYLNFDTIMDQVFFDHDNFVDLPYEDRVKLVDAQVAKVTTAVVVPAPVI